MEEQENRKLTRKEKKAMKKQQNTKKNSADKKGIVLDIFLAVVAVVLLANAISAYNKEIPAGKLIINYNYSPVEAVQNTVTETLPVVTEPQNTEKPTYPAADEERENPQDTEKENETKDEMSKQDILKAVTDGINSLKAEKAAFKAVKTQNIALKLTECSLPAFVGLVNTVLDFFAGETVTEYSFVDGKATDSKGNEVNVMGAIPPSDKEFSLTMDGLADASMKKEGENTVYTVVVVPESSTLADPRPPHHNSAGDTFDCTKVELPMGEITKADFDYPGSEISITVNSQGKVVRYCELLRINGVGEGAAMGMTASGRIEGVTTEIWEITY